MLTKTAWTKDISLKKYPQLSDSREVDVVIIGAGITGLLSGYTLAREGKKVVILEKDRIGSDATHRTTAFITQSIDTDSSDMMLIYGKDKARHILDSHKRAIDHIEFIVKQEKIDCDFERCSNYIYINSSDQFEALTQEYEALKELGINAHLSPSVLNGFKNFGYIEIKNQAKFHPMKFMNGLIQSIEKMGGEIYEQTQVTDIEESSRPVAITKNHYKITAQWIIAATYEPFNQPLGLFFKKGMYISYILEGRLPTAAIPRGIYEDTENPYHYFRIDTLDESNDSFLIGGEDHRADLPVNEDKNFKALEQYLADAFGNIQYEIINRWSGPILEPSDGLALIGLYKQPNIIHATGFSGNGMTYAAITSLISNQLINGKLVTSEYDIGALYSPSRQMKAKTLLYKARDYTAELMHGAVKNTINQKKGKKN